VDDLPQLDPDIYRARMELNRARVSLGTGAPTLHATEPADGAPPAEPDEEISREW
jgi:hypothetical protein